MNPALGQALWKLLHTYAHAYPETPTPERQLEATQWLKAFDEIIKDNSTGCACSKHWNQICAKFPPNVNTRTEFYWWTVRVHDEVNRKLGKFILYGE